MSHFGKKVYTTECTFIMLEKFYLNSNLCIYYEIC